MADTNRTLITRITQIIKSTSEWEAVKTTVLLKGEIGVERLADGRALIKVGDGTKTWAELPYASAEVVDNLTTEAADKALSAKQGKVLKGLIDDHKADEVKHITAAERSAWDAKYDKPADGIPASDLAEDYYTEDEADAKFVAIESGKRLMTDAEGEKLEGIESGAQVNKLEAVKIGATALTITDKAVTLPEASTAGAGLLSADDKGKLNGIETGAEVNILEGVQVNGTDLAISNKKVNVTVAQGGANGTIKVNGTDVAVKGLGSAAYTESSAYATAAQGALADSAVQAVVEGSTNGTIAVDGTDVAVHGLGGAAYKADTYFVQAETGKRLMTDAEGTKLAGIAEGAQVNVIETVKVNGVALTPSNKAVNVEIPSAKVEDVLIKERDDDDFRSVLDGTDAKIDLTAYALRSDITAVLIFKGVVAKVENLPDVAEVGWVYAVSEDNSEYVCTVKGTGASAPATYEKLGPVIDLSIYETKADAATEHAAIEALITAEETARISADNALDERLDVIEGADTVDGSIKKALKDAKAYADSLDTAMDARMDVVEAAKHTHDNKSVLDGITSAKVANWDAAYTDKHTHSNKTVLDGIDAADVAAWDAKYDLPDGGIPKADLASAVQTSLGKADTALQAADIVDKADKDKDAVAGNVVKAVAGGNYEDAGFAAANVVLSTDYLLLQCTLPTA